MKELVSLKKEDRKDVIPWGETHSLPTISGKVCHVGWKDQAFVLMMSSVLLGDERVVRLRKRPKETSSKANVTGSIQKGAY